MSWWIRLGRVSGGDSGMVDTSQAGGIIVGFNVAGGSRSRLGRRRFGICQGGSLTVVLFRRVLVLRWVI
jgi:hypothetical protein